MIALPIPNWLGEHEGASPAPSFLILFGLFGRRPERLGEREGASPAPSFPILPFFCRKLRRRQSSAVDH